MTGEEEADPNCKQRRAVWFSQNQEKAWTEKFFLLYSACWPLLFGGWAASGWHTQVGDVGNLVVTLLIASPNVLVPCFLAPNPQRKPFHHMYWFKFGLWIAIFTFVASYFFTEYFFDCLGMKYNFPHLHWNFDSILLGRGSQTVPIMMYVGLWILSGGFVSLVGPNASNFRFMVGTFSSLIILAQSCSSVSLSISSTHSFLCPL